MFDELKAVEETILTDREREVLELLGQGQNHERMKFSLNLSLHTIKTYIRELHNKTGIKDDILLAVSVVKSKHRKELKKIREDYDRKIDSLYEIIKKDCGIDGLNKAYQIINDLENKSIKQD